MGRLDRARRSYNRFFVDHEVAWELIMAALSIAFVVVGYVSEGVPERDALQYVAIEIGLTIVFMIEFFSRFAASYDKVGYIRGHWIDLFALIPTIRGIRLFRLVRLLRLFRAFAGVYRALRAIERFTTPQDADLRCSSRGCGGVHLLHRLLPRGERRQPRHPRARRMPSGGAS